MSAHPPLSPEPQPERPVPAPAAHGIGPEELGFVALLVLSLAGITIARFSARWGLWYWLVMVPLFAATSLYTGWRGARRRDQAMGSLVLSQVLHWSVLAGAVYLIFLLERTGRLNPEDAGLVALIALAVTTLLAGIHFDWRLAVLGLLLGVGAVCAALVQQYFWILLVPAALAGVAVVYAKRHEA